MWVIRNRKRQRIMARREQPLYWSNEYGWTSRVDATVFTEAEKEQFLLPRDGEWEEVQS